MSTAYETERELAVFIGTVGNYFRTVGGEPPEFHDPTLELELPARLDCTGYMPVGGRLDGWIALSLPAPMLDELLAGLGETERGDNLRLDLVAEITGTLTSNAREHFGEHLRVSPPLASAAQDFPATLPRPPLSLRLPFRWREADAFLLVALQCQPAAS